MKRPIVIHGDSREALRTLEENSVDACVCDPPYALTSIVERFGKPGAAPAAAGVYGRSSAGFMGQQWDTGEGRPTNQERARKKERAKADGNDLPLFTGEMEKGK